MDAAAPSHGCIVHPDPDTGFDSFMHVEGMVGVLGDTGDKKYMVMWFGHDDDANAWVPSSTMTSYSEVCKATTQTPSPNPP